MYVYVTWNFRALAPDVVNIAQPLPYLDAKTIEVNVLCWYMYVCMYVSKYVRMKIVITIGELNGLFQRIHRQTH